MINDLIETEGYFCDCFNYKIKKKYIKIPYTKQ